MSILTELPETCTVDVAAELINRAALGLGLGEGPDLRTLRSWRTLKHVTIEGRRMTRRNLLEVLAILKLRRDGLTLAPAGVRVKALDEYQLRLFLENTLPLPQALAHTSDVDEERPRAEFGGEAQSAESAITIQRLAVGLLRQYQLVRNGAIVGHTSAFETGVENTAIELYQAMARLSRQSMLEGEPDRTASMHMLMQLCMTPIHEWAPQAIRSIPRYREAILIDPVYRVPSEDCESIAEETDASSLSDLVEHHLHERLRASLRKLGPDAPASYTAIRSFVGRHPMATRDELNHFYSNPELNEAAIDFVRTLYEPVHASQSRQGIVRRCRRCRALINRDNRCTLASCAYVHPTAEWAEVPLDDAWSALPEVLKYWSDPAQEELRLYDALAVIAPQQVLLYPECDRCDVAIGETIGVDVKDYRDPVRLAYRLNRSIGQLSRYPRRILAIADRRWEDASYAKRLSEQLSPDRRASLEIMSVSTTLRTLKSVLKEQHHG